MPGLAEPAQDGAGIDLDAALQAMRVALAEQGLPYRVEPTADLAILAAPPQRYAEYARDVRQEYADVPDEHFTRGRTAVLGDLLAKESLFHTTAARERWEDAARTNVSAELATLRGSG